MVIHVCLFVRVKREFSTEGASEDWPAVSGVGLQLVHKRGQWSLSSTLNAPPTHPPTLPVAPQRAQTQVLNHSLKHCSQR